jgi:phosphoglycerate dehydrogenase-like enzyme
MADPIEVLITLPLEEKLAAELQAHSSRLSFTMLRARKPEEIPQEIWERTEVLYTNRVIPTPELAPKLRWIQFHWAGINHVIDAPILSKPDLVATNLSGASASQMAEFAVMMMLALGHHLPELGAYQKRAEWPSERWEQFAPQELRGSTVGILGYGSIGRQTARLLQGFGARVLATKRDAMHPEDTGYHPADQGDPGGDLVHRLYPTQARISMLKECDFVLVAVPLTPDTRGLIGVRELAALKPTAYLVDFSRGGVVDHAALVIALREHKIAGAALDVFSEEPLSSESPLWKLPNVILTPHIGGFSTHYDERAIALFIENLNRYLEGLPLFNQVDLVRGY